MAGETAQSRKCLPCKHEALHSVSISCLMVLDVVVQDYNLRTGWGWGWGGVEKEGSLGLRSQPTGLIGKLQAKERPSLKGGEWHSFG